MIFSLLYGKSKPSRIFLSLLILATSVPRSDWVFSEVNPRLFKKIESFKLLTQKGQRVAMSVSTGRSFQLLDESLVTQPVLGLFDPALEIGLYTDANRLRLGGILVQLHENREQVVAYFSIHTTASEVSFF